MLRRHTGTRPLTKRRQRSAPWRTILRRCSSGRDSYGACSLLTDCKLQSHLHPLDHKLTTYCWHPFKISSVHCCKSFISLCIAPENWLHLIVARTLNMPCAAHAFPVAQSPLSSAVSVPLPRRICCHNPLDSTRRTSRYSEHCRCASVTSDWLLLRTP